MVVSELNARLSLASPWARPLAGGVVVVTGASGGIGGAIARHLAALGATAGLVGRDEAKLDTLAEQVRQHAPASRAYPTDWADERAVAHLRDELAQDLGRVDALIVCGGLNLEDSLEEASIDHLDQQYRANVRGPYLTIQALLPLLKQALGQVIFINSTQGLVAKAKAGQYAATQHALKALADSLREEVNDYGVRVTSIFIGRTATPRQEKIFGLEGKTYRPQVLMQPEDVAAVVSTALLLPRTAELTNVQMRPMRKSY